MRKAIRSSLALGALALAMAVPMSGQALHSTAGNTVECEGTATSAPTTSCTAGIVLSGSVFASNLESHGNVQELGLSGATVTLTWHDAAGNLIFTSICSVTGLSLDGTGPLDAQNFTCENEYVTDDQGNVSYQEGLQQLTTTVTGATEGSTFRGRLVFSEGSSLI